MSNGDKAKPSLQSEVKRLKHVHIQIFSVFLTKEQVNDKEIALLDNLHMEQRATLVN